MYNNVQGESPNLIIFRYDGLAREYDVTVRGNQNVNIHFTTEKVLF